MAYLVCNECGGYYKLQPGESPDNFDLTCKCGGTLEYKDNLNDTKNVLASNRRKTSLDIKYIIPFILIFQSAMNICAISYNLPQIILFLGIMGVTCGLIFLLIRFMDLEKKLTITYRRLIYLLIALLFAIENYGLIIMWPYIPNYSRGKFGIILMIFLGIIAILIMFLKIASPDEFEKRIREKLNSRE